MQEKIQKKYYKIKNKITIVQKPHPFKSLWKNKNKSRWRFELNYKPVNPKI